MVTLFYQLSESCMNITIEQDLHEQKLKTLKQIYGRGYRA